MQLRWILLLTALWWATPPRLEAEDWPVWRGPRLDGTSLGRPAPLHWSPTSNIVWKAQLPGFGHASPILREGRLFTVCVLSNTSERVLLSFDRSTGRELWRSTVLTAPLEKRHPLNSHASSTPAADADQVYTAFLDVDRMLVSAHTLGGAVRWQVRPGPFRSMHGFCSSPILYKNLVIVNGDHDGDSYLVALDRADGHTVWKTPRENHTRSYCVPILRPLAGRMQMVLSGDKCIASYDPGTGARHWIIDGPTEQFVASVVYSDRAQLLIASGGFPDHHILAIRPDGTGNITGSHIAWRATKGVSYVPSPICAGDYFLIVSDAGFATCFEAATGRLLWQERLGERHASLVSSAGLVYFLNDQGVMNIVRPGPAFDRVAQNEIGEPTFASPALSDGQLFLRGSQSLFCIEERSGSREPRP